MRSCPPRLLEVTYHVPSFFLLRFWDVPYYPLLPPSNTVGSIMRGPSFSLSLSLSLSLSPPLSVFHSEVASSIPLARGKVITRITDFLICCPSGKATLKPFPLPIHIPGQNGACRHVHTHTTHMCACSCAHTHTHTHTIQQTTTGWLELLGAASSSFGAVYNYTYCG